MLVTQSIKFVMDQVLASVHRNLVSAVRSSPASPSGFDDRVCQSTVLELRARPPTDDHYAGCGMTTGLLTEQHDHGRLSKLGWTGRHETMADMGMTKIRPLSSFVVTHGKPVKLAPGRYHIIMMGLQTPLK